MKQYCPRFLRGALWKTVLLLLMAVPLGHAQHGDKRGESQPPPPFPVPPSPPLSPEEALKTLKAAPGFHVELVAGDPLVQDPVAMAFDPDGRIWVVEMTGYMPDVDATGEDKPTGRVVVLEDTNGDGKMDKRTVFADGLVMPRAIALARDGALIAEPPNLWFMQDTDGDGKADTKTAVAKDYGNRLNPEHTANGLLRALDNWIYSANYTARFLSLEDDWKREPTAFRGQWGIAQDDFGRLFFDSNEDQLRCDLAPSAYLVRNPDYRSPLGLNYQVMKDQSVWPARVNPGVTRGYRAGQLRANGTLANFTAACGPTIYRGDNFPPEFRGNAFVCEPAGNLVKRDILFDHDGVITGKRAYEKSEFLASTDERFRPVNLYTAPDGTLYVVDMYHGIMQHRIYVTTYLRKQIKERGLEQPLHVGRIYRVIHDGTPRGPTPHLSKATAAELVNLLSHPNGWWRDTAQRLLVEKNDSSVIPALESKALTDTNELGQIHALWTLEGMDALDKKTVFEAMSSPNTKVRATAIRLSEPWLKAADKMEVVTRLAAMAKNDLDADTQTQLAFTLGQVQDPLAEEVMLPIACNSSKFPLTRDALVSGLAGREVEFLGLLLASDRWQEKQSGNSELLTSLAQCIMAGGRSKNVGALLNLMASQAGKTAWRQLAMLEGVANSVPPLPKGARKRVVKLRPVRFESEPVAWKQLKKANDPRIRRLLAGLDGLITWPGQPGYEPPAPVIPLTAQQQARYDAGKILFEGTCAQCHQPHGLGQEGLAPPLVDSEWVLGPEKRVARIALQGARGRIMVRGRNYSMDMPAFGAVFSDEQLASILTYIRRSWDNGGVPVEPATVKKVRAETAKHDEAWTEAELLKVR